MTYPNLCEGHSAWTFPEEGRDPQKLLIFQVSPSMSWFGHHHASTRLLHGAMDGRLCFSSVVNYSQRPTGGGWCKQEGYTGAEGPRGEAWEAPQYAHGLSSLLTLKLTLSDRSFTCALSRNLRLSTHCSRALVYLSRLPALSLVLRVSLSSHPTPSCLLELVEVFVLSMTH